MQPEPRVTCSSAFTVAAADELPNSSATVDWSHVARLFADAMETVRREESKKKHCPKWRVGQFSKAARSLPSNSRRLLKNFSPAAFILPQFSCAGSVKIHYAKKRIDNCQNQRRKSVLLHEKFANQRKDFLHK